MGYALGGSAYGKTRDHVLKGILGALGPT